MSIILDAMGSDDHPIPEIEAAIQAKQKYGVDVILVGSAAILEPLLKEKNINHVPVSIRDAPDVLEMHEKPVEASRKKPRNSMAVGLELLKTGEGSAFMSAGNTGGVFFNALRILGRIEGVQRPALTTMFPTLKGKCVVLDIGANADCRPEFLAQFAVLGSMYAEKVLQIKQPRVGLLSNGEEDGKGNQLIKDTYPLLGNLGINYIGNVEPKELFNGEVDVVVTDGFSGNILLKTSESVARMIMAVLKQEFTSSLTTKIGALLGKPAFAKIKQMLDPTETGAAPLLGIDGLVFIGHGRSNTYALVNALCQAQQAVDMKVMEALRDSFSHRLDVK